MPYAFLKMINMSITAGWMILAVMLLRLILTRAPKAIRYILWALVALRLILPVSFESVTSLIPNTEPVSEGDLIYVPYETVPYTEFDPSVNPDDPVYLEMFVATVPDESAMTSDELITIVWIAGSAAMLVYCAVSYAVLRRKVRPSVKLRDRIYVCDTIGSPFILGIIRPRIYIPSSITDEQMTAVEAHERMHIRHGDHLWKLLGFAILSAYWWNPLIWAAYVLFCRDIELICDEAVVKKMDPSDRAAYSEALLSFNMPRRLVSACPLAFGEVGVKSRIKSVLDYKKPTLWIIIVAIIACAVTAVCLLTDPVDKDKSDPFRYDRISVTVFGDGGEDVDVHFDSLDAGSTYELPGYGDVEKVICTVESADPEKKIVKLRLDPPLRRVGGGNAETVSLLLDNITYEGIGYDNLTLESPDGSGMMYHFAHAVIAGNIDDAPENETGEKRPIDEYIEWGRIPKESVYSGEEVSLKIKGLKRPTVETLYCSGDNDIPHRFFEAMDVGSFTVAGADVSPRGNCFEMKFTDKFGSIGDYTVYYDDTVVYGALSDPDNALYFKASEGTFDRLAALEEELNRPDSIRNISAYPESYVRAYVYGLEHPNRKTYSESARFYEALNPDTFTKIELDVAPELESFRVFFTKASDSYSMGDYTVFEDDTVLYYLRRVSNQGVYYKASDGTYERLIALEKELIESVGTVTLPTPTLPEESDTRISAALEGADHSDIFVLYRSAAAGAGTLDYYPAWKSSLGPISYSIGTTLTEKFTLSLCKDDNGRPQLLAEYGGKKQYYDIVADDGLSLRCKDGDSKFILLAHSLYHSVHGKLDSDNFEDKVTVQNPTSVGALSFTVSVLCGNGETYSAVYIPKELCTLTAVSEDDGTLKLKATVGDSVTYADITVGNGNLSITGLPEVFGKMNYLIEKESVVTEYIAKKNMDFDKDSSMDTLYLTEGPLSGRYSFTVVADCRNYDYVCTYAYDEPYELSFVLDSKNNIQLRVVDTEGKEHLFDIVLWNNRTEIMILGIDESRMFEKVRSNVVEAYGNISIPSASANGDIDGDGQTETVIIGPGSFSGLSSFSLTVIDGPQTFGPHTYATEAISIVPVEDENGGVRLRAEYEDDVVFYEFHPYTAEESGMYVPPHISSIVIFDKNRDGYVGYTIKDKDGNPIH